MTYNCGKLSVADALPALFANVDPNLHQVIVVGLQEVAPIINGCFADVGSYLDPVEAALRLRVHDTHKQVARYTHGSIALIVYVDRRITHANVMFASASCGYLSSSLKGAVGAHMSLDSQKFTFVAAHLAANEGMVAQRNQDFQAIATTLDFGNSYGLYQPDSHIFVLGDLNYRCISDPLTGLAHVDQVAESDVLLSDYHAVDELSIELEKNATFFGFHEAPITFAPTYKFHVGSSTYDRRRIPSWCDRILFLGYQDSTQVEFHAYKSLVDCCSSDHKPVLLDISIPSEHPPMAASVSIDQHYADSDSVSVALDPSRSSIKRLGSIVDRAIGWTLWFGTTRRGNFTLCLGVLLLIACYSLF